MNFALWYLKCSSWKVSQQLQLGDTIMTSYRRGSEAQSWSLRVLSGRASDLSTMLAVSSTVSQLLPSKVTKQFTNSCELETEMWRCGCPWHMRAFRHFGCAAESTDPCLCDIQNPAQHQQLMCYMRVAFSLYTRTKYSVHFFKLMQLYIIHLSSVGILISLSTYSSMLTGQTGQC